MNSKPYADIFQHEDDQSWDWRLVANNGELVCSSLQGYRDKTDALRGFLDAQDLFGYLNIEVRYA